MRYGHVRPDSDWPMWMLLHRRALCGSYAKGFVTHRAHMRGLAARCGRRYICRAKVCCFVVVLL